MSAAAQVHVVVAPVFGTNCCVVAAGGPGGSPRDCVVVDAGAGVAEGVARVVREQELRPRAVLATHGHVDHTWDAAALCARYEVPLLIHAADAYRIGDPFGTLTGALPGPAGDATVSGALARQLAGLGFAPEAYRPPEPVQGFDTPGGRARLTFGDLTLRAVHAPGHTEGSTLYLLDLPPGTPGTSGQGTGPGASSVAGPSGIALTGDVLFAGSVGRTDLPGGDDATMRATLRDVVARLDPRLAVVPGHGPTTSVERELAANPYLA